MIHFWDCMSLCMHGHTILIFICAGLIKYVKFDTDTLYLVQCDVEGLRQSGSFSLFISIWTDSFKSSALVSNRFYRFQYEVGRCFVNHFDWIVIKNWFHKMIRSLLTHSWTVSGWCVWAHMRFSGALAELQVSTRTHGSAVVFSSPMAVSLWNWCPKGCLSLECCLFPRPHDSWVSSFGVADQPAIGDTKQI